ncbi:Uncharacterised protein [Acinetobacter baumannii]|nr:Uncharacterised protein [Acinetobacter baumannii]
MHNQYLLRLHCSSVLRHCWYHSRILYPYTVHLPHHIDRAMAAMPKRHKLGFWQYPEWHFLRKLLKRELYLFYQVFQAHLHQKLHLNRHSLRSLLSLAITFYSMQILRPHVRFYLHYGTLIDHLSYRPKQCHLWF